jgi:hypothetical protein
VHASFLVRHAGVDPFTRAEAEFEMAANVEVEVKTEQAVGPTLKPSSSFAQRSAAISRNWTALSAHWYAIWLIAYHGERQTKDIVTKLAVDTAKSKLKSSREQGIQPPNLDAIELPEAYHPTFNSWWSRLVLRVLVTRYIIRVRLACYYESINYLMKLCIVVVGTASRLGEEKQAFMLVGVYTFFAACTFWVAPYRPVEARIAVHYEPLQLLLFPLFMQACARALHEGCCCCRCAPLAAAHCLGSSPIVASCLTSFVLRRCLAGCCLRRQRRRWLPARTRSGG